MNLTKGQRFIKVFPSNLFHVNACFLMWPTINSSKFSWSNLCTIGFLMADLDSQIIEILHDVDNNT